MTVRAGRLPDGGVLAARAGLDVRPRRVPALILGAALACIGSCARNTSLGRRAR